MKINIQNWCLNDVKYSIHKISANELIHESVIPKSDNISINHICSINNINALAICKKDNVSWQSIYK